MSLKNVKFPIEYFNTLEIIYPVKFYLNMHSVQSIFKLLMSSCYTQISYPWYRFNFVTSFVRFNCTNDCYKLMCQITENGAWNNSSTSAHSFLSCCQWVPSLGCWLTNGNQQKNHLQHLLKCRLHLKVFWSCVCWGRGGWAQRIYIYLNLPNDVDTVGWQTTLGVIKS
jgi:hypothetical protein